MLVFGIKIQSASTTSREGAKTQRKYEASAFGGGFQP
jgi:hypothetical protein